MDTQQQMVHKDMTMGEIVEKFPQAVEVLQGKYGLHCVGCGVSTWETLEQGGMGHGMEPEQVEQMVQDVNEHISKNPVQARQGHPAEGATIHLTETAVAKVKELMAREKKEGQGFKVAVIPGGCSGFEYDLNFTEKADEGDHIFEHNGLRVFIDPLSLEMLNGTTIDYVDSLHGSGFKIENPNAQHSCGCGSSFS